ncbi:hypothetical protein EVAR_41903_1 [Eumeta japonica]|uniref:Uncharacterized protein n=1 Tax=Eumeta variegata TaxID=151549 RepID=A0A4C1YLZ4_EUMVA|nr:hypothetical protein EVAR_41903_1 [Eumeta japonica]
MPSRSVRFSSESRGSGRGAPDSECKRDTPGKELPFNDNNNINSTKYSESLEIEKILQFRLRFCSPARNKSNGQYRKAGNALVTTLDLRDPWTMMTIYYLVGRVPA